MGVLRLNGKAYGGGIDVIEVTQAQYNALPESKLSDDILYVISDSVNGSDGYPPLIYSDQEREVGVWRDGKPLYQITLIDTSALTGTSKEIDISSLHCEYVQIINLQFHYLDSTYNQYTPIPRDNNFVNIVDLTGNKIILSYTTTIAENRANHGYVLTLQYTKTTDTAGSGIWNGQGGYAHHYSASETVVGTWIDGKPLYEKTKHFAFSDLTHLNNLYYKAISDTDEKLRYVKSAYVYSASYGAVQLGCFNYVANNNYTDYWELGMYYDNICLSFHGNLSASTVNPTDVYVTYQYTKTTD